MLVSPETQPALGEPAVAALTSLFGSRGRHRRPAGAQQGRGPALDQAEPDTMAALSRLARLDAARITSPVAGSPLWAVEAAQLAGRPGSEPG